MPSLTVENYLKAALQITIRTGRQSVSTGELAAALDVSPGTVTSMLKTLGDSNLVEYRPYEGARLTEAGRTLALRMLRRHRLIELFLVETLGLSWDQVHEEAENMEHAVSDVLIKRIDEFLGHPECDPHGDPIPTEEGRFRGQPGTTMKLTDCPPETRVQLVRVTNQNSEFLRYLSESGMEIGTVFRVLENNPAAEVVTARLGERSMSISHAAANALLVKRKNNAG